jgi:lactate dehydrogenase-like 2-hydroxyacid dehydrogenase
MIPVNSVLQVGHFPEIMQAEIDRRFTPIRHPDINAAPPAGNFEAILIRSNTKLPEALVKKIPSIRLVSTCGVGYDNLPLGYLQAQGIKATNTPGVLNDAVCELAIGMMLSLMRRLPESQEYVKSNAWAKAPFRLTATLAGKRVGIAGMGRIGQDLAKRLEPFKVEIAYSGPNPKQVPYTYFKEITDLARACDVLFLACPATPDTDNLVDTAVLEALGPSSYLINIARGSVVNEAALLYALQHKQIAGAALDVFNNEPCPNPAFLDLDNVLLTPHIGSATLETRVAMTNLAVDNLEAFFTQQPLLSEVHY